VRKSIEAERGGNENATTSPYCERKKLTIGIQNFIDDKSSTDIFNKTMANKNVHFRARF
jgi:hypothetical protein